MRRHLVGISAERPDADDWISRIAIHVDGRRQVVIHSCGNEIRCDRRRDTCRQFEVVHHAERQIARVGATRPIFESGDVAAFFVEGNQCIRRGVVNGLRNAGDRPVVHEVVPVNRHAGESLVERPAYPVR